MCLLHAYANPEHERRIGLVLRRALPGTFITLSHEILREYREYERTSTTVLNAYVGPLVQAASTRIFAASDSTVRSRSCARTAA